MLNGPKNMTWDDPSRRYRCRGTVVSILAAGAGLLPMAGNHAPKLEAQQSSRMEVTSSHSCARCRIAASKVFALGSEDDSLGASVASSVLRTRQATYLAATLGARGSDQVRVYGSDGRFLRRIGRKGDGPGEFRSITHVALAPGDSIYVFQPLRLSVLTPEGRFARTVPLPFGATLQAVVTATSDLLLSAQSFSRHFAGHPVHRFSADGQVLGSFGAEPPDVIRDRPSLSMRNMALGRDGRLWLARPDLYQIEEWTVEGRRLRTLTRNADWFPPRNVEMHPNRPTPFVLDMRVGEDGNLWILATREDADWRRYGGIIGKDRPYSQIERDGLYDTMVEVINPNSGRLVTSLRLPFRARGFVDSRHLWVLRETDTGLFMIDVWQLELNRNEENP